MAVELKVPALGESITEVEIGEWRKAKGDSVKKDETVALLESEKATVELVSPVTGTLTEILKRKGETAAVGEVIGRVDEMGKTLEQKPAAAVTTKESAPAKETVRAKEPVPAKEPARVMPAAQRILSEQKLRPEEVTATGPGGRLLKEDVLSHLENQKKEPAPAETTASQKPAEAAETPKSDAEKPAQGSPGTKAGGPREEEVVAMSRLRRTVAERLVQAQHAAALLTTFNEMDMSAVMGLRKEFAEAFQAKYGVKLGFMSFFVKATVDALKLIPQVNAEVRGTNIVYRNFCDIGVAIGGGKGLVVPVLRNAERMSFAEIEVAIHDFGKRAKENKLNLEELQGGTFTISNGGVYGSMLSTPIINPPQSGILGMHAIQDRPVAREGNVVIRPMMYAALTYDHRIVDGREAVTFLKRIKDLIESPARMLIEA
jgi:2-oxoglutarate dehydrogenase E2 component (dihydrolipoamide succinyltransferase)